MNQIRVLIADDHDLVRAGICNVLREISNVIIVGEVGDGPALFEALAQTNPNCLLVDVAMPNFDPINAIRQIRTTYPDLRILVVSAYDDDAYVQGLLREGVNGYHLKNQPLNELRLAVEQIMAGQRWISSPLVDKLFSTALPQSVPTLPNRQRELLQLLMQGLDNQAISRELRLSVKTVEKHLTRLYRKLNVQSRLEAVNYAIRHPNILVQPESSTSQPTFSPKTTQAQIKILLVDDNSRYRRKLRLTIEDAYPSITVYEAGSIAEALEIVKNVSPEFILVDMILGEENGIQCVRRIHALQPEIRIILMSAYPDREFHRLGLEAGATAFLDKKDLTAKALYQIVDDMINF